MDTHARWLRRFLVGRIASRLFVESAVVAAVALSAALAVELDTVVGVLVAVAAAQAFAFARVVSAVMLNPVNHRYLSRWEDTAHRLQPVDADDLGEGPLDASLVAMGFGPLTRLARPEAADSGFDVYASSARLVVVSASRDGEPLVIVSRVSDGRILITTRELVPPHTGVIVNQNRRATMADLIESHVEMLEVLRRQGLHVVEAGHEIVVDQVRLEWQAWDHLGPFIGPFLAVGRRPKPLVLQARVPEHVLWERTATSSAPVERAALALPSGERHLRLVDAA